MLSDLVSEAIAGADPVARARSVRLGGSVDDGIVLTADAAGMSRVMTNLIMNAIRHTPADGVVEIRGRAQSISRENPQPARVAGDSRVERNLHRNICDAGRSHVWNSRLRSNFVGMLGLIHA